MRIVWAGVLGLALCCAWPARADDADPGVEVRREQLYREGTELAGEGRWKEAAARFREVVALRAAPRALIALGVAEENLGRLLSARAAYERAHVDARAGGIVGDQRSAADALDKLDEKIPRVSIDAPAVAGLVARLDGAIVDADAALPVDPGRHVVTVEAPGRHSFRGEVSVRAGEHTVVMATLPEHDDGGSAAPPAPAMVLGGIGVGVMASAFILWGAGRSIESDVEQRCPGGRCPESLREQLEPSIEHAHDRIVAGNVLLGAGIALLAGGGTWWAVSAARTDGATSARTVFRF